MLVQRRNRRRIFYQCTKQGGHLWPSRNHHREPAKMGDAAQSGDVNSIKSHSLQTCPVLENLRQLGDWRVSKNREILTRTTFLSSPCGLTKPTSQSFGFRDGHPVFPIFANHETFSFGATWPKAMILMNFLLMSPVLLVTIWLFNIAMENPL